MKRTLFHLAVLLGCLVTSSSQAEPILAPDQADATLRQFEGLWVVASSQLPEEGVIAPIIAMSIRADANQLWIDVSQEGATTSYRGVIVATAEQESNRIHLIPRDPFAAGMTGVYDLMHTRSRDNPPHQLAFNLSRKGEYPFSIDETGTDRYQYVLFRSAPETFLEDIVRYRAKITQPDSFTDLKNLAVSKVFTLKYSQATEVAEILKQVYDKGPSKIVPDARTNSVIVIGPEGQLQEIEALLLKLNDAGSQQPTVQAVPIGSESAQPLTQLRKDYEAADAQAHQLAKQLKQSPDAAKQAELRQAVQRAFTARQSLLRAELMEMQTRLLQTQRSIDLRERISDQIIQRRFEDLLNPQLEWEGTPKPAESSHPFLSDNRNDKTSEVHPPAEEATLTQVEALFQLILERNPTQRESEAWAASLRQGQSLSDVQAILLCHNSVFDRVGRDQVQYIQYLHEIFLSRKPTPEESAFWSSRYDAMKGVRTAFVGEFMRSMNSLASESQTTEPITATSIAPLPQEQVARLSLSNPFLPTSRKGNRLGLVLGKATPLSIGSRFSSGVLVESVDPGGSADRQGIKAGDILVRLGTWDTPVLEHADFILEQEHTQPLRFYVVRMQDVLSGHMTEGPPNEARDNPGIAVPAPELRETIHTDSNKNEWTVLGVKLAFHPAEGKPQTGEPLPGVLQVESIRPDSPATHAGLHVSDILEKLGPLKITSPKHVTDVLREFNSRRLAYSVIRDGKLIEGIFRTPHNGPSEPVPTLAEMQSTPSLVQAGDPKSAMLAKLQGVWKVQTYAINPGNPHPKVIGEEIEITGNMMTVWAVTDTQRVLANNAEITLGEPGPPQQIDMVFGPNDGKDRLETFGLIEINDDLVRICVENCSESKRPVVFAVGQRAEIWELRRNTDSGAATELEGDWHLVAYYDHEGKPRETLPSNRSFRGDQSSFVMPGYRHDCRIKVDPIKKTLCSYSKAEDGSFGQDYYELKGDQLILRNEPGAVGYQVFERGLVRIPSVVPAATEEQKLLWRSAIVEIVTYGDSHVNNGGENVVGRGVVVSPGGLILAHLAGRWDPPLKDRKVMAIFDDGSQIPLTVVEEGDGFIALQPEKPINANHYFKLSQTVVQQHDEVRVWGPDHYSRAGSDSLAPYAESVTVLDRKYPALGVAVWQLSFRQHLILGTPVLDSQGDLLGITITGTQDLLLAVPVAQLREMFPKTFSPATELESKPDADKGASPPP